MERISNLLARAVRVGMYRCQDVVNLYNTVFTGTLGLWTKRFLGCRDGGIVVK